MLDPKSGYNPEHVARSITVEIDAPAEVVWEILTDLPRYGEWNPFCIRCESTLDMGAPVTMTMRNAWNEDTVTFVEYICAFEPPHMLAWEMYWSEEWPYAGRREQIVESLGPERCSYHTTDAFLGDNGIHIMRFAHGWIKAGFDATCLALKARAESLWSERRTARP